MTRSESVDSARLGCARNSIVRDSQQPPAGSDRQTKKQGAAQTMKQVITDQNDDLQGRVLHIPHCDCCKRVSSMRMSV